MFLKVYYTRKIQKVYNYFDRGIYSKPSGHLYMVRTVCQPLF